MSYEPLHHKYRPQTFRDLVGQSAIAQTLSNAIQQQKIAPAYLFTGPRGTGKTSSARILAKSLNCLNSERPTPEPCGKCEVCQAIALGTALDVIEIDAASNTGVDNIREIIERSQFAPVQCRYKVYAIDECLTGDSLIQTNTGLMRIDAPKLKGKLVLSYNENTQVWEYKKVLRWLERGIKETLVIKTSNYLIHCTKNHLIHTDKGWIKAGNVKEGMKILSPLKETGNREQGIVTINLEKVEFVRQDGYEKVYDLEVEDNHNFVANGLLVHNCHMLSTAAFNALLKTLEEPPPRVVFILATTDPQRVLPTIISRCQRFDYRRIGLEEMVNHLEYIAQKEQINIDSEAIKLVGQVANGGLRDAESLLDQLSLFPEKITIDQVWDLVGAIPEQELLILLQEIRNKNFAEVLYQCRNLLDRGREPITVLQNLASFYVNLLIAKSAPQSSNLVAVTENCWEKLKAEASQWQQDTILKDQQKLKEAEPQIKNTTQPRLWLEVTLLGLLSEPNIIPQDISPTKVANNIVNKADIPSLTVKPTTEDKLESKQLEDDTPKIVAFTPTQDREIVTEQSSSNNKVVAITKNKSVKESSRSKTDTEAIWQQAIAIIEPPTTRTLLSQKCHLIALEDSMAIIGISAPPLLRLLQGKVSNIETAFTQVCHRNIKVTFDIASDGGVSKRQVVSPKQEEETVKESVSSPKDNHSDQATASSHFQPEAGLPKPIPSTKTVSDNSFNRTSSTIESQESPAVLENSQNIDNKVNSDLAYQPKVSHYREESIDIISSEAEFTKAVELIAKTFDGDIIDLDNYSQTQEFKDIDSQNEQNTSDVSDTTQHNKPNTIIANRPDVSLYQDEDDIPF